MSEAVRRWRSDEINRKDEQKKKILGEVQSSRRNVSTKTMKKYNIDYAEINVRREMGGLERIRMYQVPTTGVRTRSGRGGEPGEGGGIATRPAGDFMRHNEEVDKITEDFARQRLATVEAVGESLEEQAKLIQEKLLANPNRRIQVPAEEAFSVSTIHDYFWGRDADGNLYTYEYKPGHKVATGTIITRFGSEDNWKTGALHTVIKKFPMGERVCFADIRPCIKKMDEIVETLRLIPTEGEGALKNTSKLGYLESLYVTIRHFNGGILLKEQYGKDALIEIDEYRKELKELVLADIAKIRANEILLMDWKSVVKKFEEKFGKKSKENLYIQLYNEVPSRDDLGRLFVSPQLNVGSANEREMNYIFKKNGVWNIYLNVYKTRRAYGRYEDKLSAGLGKMIDDFIEREKPGKFLFSGYGTGKMSADVAKWLKAIGAKDMTTPGSINLLRHIYVAYHFPEDEVKRLGLTGPEITKLRKTMRHSPVATQAYVRKVAKKELTEEQERVLEDAEYSRFERPKTRSQTRNETSL